MRVTSRKDKRTATMVFRFFKSVNPFDYLILTIVKVKDLTPPLTGYPE